jgi:hypothetical protein
VESVPISFRCNLKPRASIPSHFFTGFFSMIAASEIFILNSVKATSHGKAVASLTQG